MLRAKLGWNRLGGVLAGALALAVALPAQALPQAFEARYSASARGLPVGEVELHLEREGLHYQYRSQMESTGLVGLFRPERIREVSRGELTPTGVQPDRYDYRRTGSEDQANHVVFTAGQEAAVLRYKGETRTALLPVEALDPLSLQIALMRDVARGQQRMRYLIAEPKRLQAYELQVQGREQVQLAGQLREAVRVDLVGRRKLELDTEFDLHTDPIPPVEPGARTSFWLLPDQDYLVGRIRHEDPEDGSFAIELERVSSLQRKPLTASR